MWSSSGTSGASGLDLSEDTSDAIGSGTSTAYSLGGFSVMEASSESVKDHKFGKWEHGRPLVRVQSQLARDENPLLMEYPADLGRSYYSLCVPYADFSYDVVKHNLFDDTESVLGGSVDVSGIVFEQEEATWDMGDLLPGTTGFPAEIGKGDQTYSIIPDSSGADLNLRLSATPSFSGFDSLSGASLGTVLQALEDLVTGGQKDANRSETQPSNGPARVLAPAGKKDSGSELEDGVAKELPHRSQEGTRSPIRTRSAGPVQDLPYVQPKTIEYISMKTSI